VTGQFMVHISSNEIKTCDASQINQIGNEIVTNSILKAINETTRPLSDQFEQQDEQSKENGSDDYFEPAYNSPFGDAIYDDLDRYRKIVPTVKHLKDISRLVQ
jgi:hypothetical protein